MLKINTYVALQPGAPVNSEHAAVCCEHRVRKEAAERAVSFPLAGSFATSTALASPVDALDRRATALSFDPVSTEPPPVSYCMKRRAEYNAKEAQFFGPPCVPHPGPRHADALFCRPPLEECAYAADALSARLTRSASDGAVKVVPAALSDQGALVYVAATVPDPMVARSWFGLGNVELIGTLNIADLVPQVQLDLDCLELRWIDQQATFFHRANVFDTEREYILNLAIEMHDVPATLRGPIDEAMSKGLGYLIIYGEL